MNKKTLLKTLSALLLLLLFSGLTSCVKDSEEEKIDTITLVSTTYPSGGQLTTSEWEQLYVDLNTCKIAINASTDSASLVDSLELCAQFLDAYYRLHYSEKINGTTLITGTDYKNICDGLDDNYKGTYEYKCILISRDILYYFNKQMKLIEGKTETEIIKTLFNKYPDYMLPYDNYEYAYLLDLGISLDSIQ